MLGGESAIASAVSLETSVSTSTLQVIPVAAVDMSSNTINEINVPSTVTPQVSIDKNIMADLIEAANSIVAPMLATASGVSDLGILSVPSASYLAVPTTIYGGFTPQTASSLSVATIVPQMSGSTTTPLGSSGIPLSVVHGRHRCFRRTPHCNPSRPSHRTIYWMTRPLSVFQQQQLSFLLAQPRLQWLAPWQRLGTARITLKLQLSSVSWAFSQLTIKRQPGTAMFLVNNEFWFTLVLVYVLHLLLTHHFQIQYLKICNPY
jgi:hypothetical protein